MVRCHLIVKNRTVSLKIHSKALNAESSLTGEETKSHQEPQDCIFQLSPDAVSLLLLPHLPAPMFSLLCYWFHRAAPLPAPSLSDFLYPEPTAGLPPLISKRNKPGKELSLVQPLSWFSGSVCLQLWKGQDELGWSSAPPIGLNQGPVRGRIWGRRVR